MRSEAPGVCPESEPPRLPLSLDPLPERAFHTVTAARSAAAVAAAAVAFGGASGHLHGSFGGVGTVLGGGGVGGVGGVPYHGADLQVGGRRSDAPGGVFGLDGPASFCATSNLDFLAGAPEKSEDKIFDSMPAKGRPEQFLVLFF